ncbi:hypothetical protein RFI_38053, partial [Reticulomyxa filosa]
VSAWTVILVYFIYCTISVSVYMVWGQSLSNDFIKDLDPDDDNFQFFLGHSYARAIQFAICISCFVAIPLFAFEARTNLHAIVHALYYPFAHRKLPNESQEENERSDKNKNKEDNHSDSDRDEQWLEHEQTVEDAGQIWTVRLIEGLSLCLTAAIVALFVDNLSLILAIVGATCCVFFMFFLPGFVYIESLRVIGRENWDTFDHRMNYVALFMIGFGVFIGVSGIVTITGFYFQKLIIGLYLEKNSKN